MKKIVIVLSLALAASLSSCIKDRGSYDYVVINEIAVEEVDEMYNVTQFERFACTPRITQTLNEDESNLEYCWMARKNNDAPWDTLSVERNCNIEVKLPPGSYSGIFIARDKALRNFARADFGVNVFSSLGQGMIVLTERNDEAFLCYISEETMIQDIFEMSNPGISLGRNPHRISFLPQGSNESVPPRIVVLCKDERGGRLVDPLSFIADTVPLSANFMIPPANLSKIQFIETTGACGGFMPTRHGSFDIAIAEGRLTTRQRMDYYLMREVTAPNPSLYNGYYGFDPSLGENRYYDLDERLAFMMGSTTGLSPGTLMAYDKIGKRLLRLKTITPNGMIEWPEKEYTLFSPRSFADEMFASGFAKRPTTQVTYFMIGKSATGTFNYYEFYFNSSVFTPTKLTRLDIPGLDMNSVFEGSGYSQSVFIGVGGKLYRFDNTTDVYTAAEVASFPGKTVAVLKTTNTAETDKIVASENLHVAVYDTATDTFDYHEYSVGIDGSLTPVASRTGMKGRPVHMCWKF